LLEKLLFLQALQAFVVSVHITSDQLLLEKDFHTFTICKTFIGNCVTIVFCLHRMM